MVDVSNLFPELVGTSAENAKEATQRARTSWECVTEYTANNYNSLPALPLPSIFTPWDAERRRGWAASLMERVRAKLEADEGGTDGRGLINPVTGRRDNNSALLLRVFDICAEAEQLVCLCTKKAQEITALPPAARNDRAQKIAEAEALRARLRAVVDPFLNIAPYKAGQQTKKTSENATPREKFAQLVNVEPREEFVNELTKCCKERRPREICLLLKVCAQLGFIRLPSYRVVAAVFGFNFSTAQKNLTDFGNASHYTPTELAGARAEIGRRFSKFTET